MLELGAQRLLARDRVGTTACERHVADQIALLGLGQIGEQDLAHRSAVGGQARTWTQVQIDLVLTATEAARAIDIQDLGTVEHRHVDRVAGALAQLLQVRTRMLTQARRVERRHTQVGDSQTKAILTRSTLLEETESDQRNHIAMRGRAAHSKVIRDIGDPEHGTLRRKAAKDREPPLQRLGIARLTKAGYRPLALLAVFG